MRTSFRQKSLRPVVDKLMEVMHPKARNLFKYHPEVMEELEKEFKRDFEKALTDQRAFNRLKQEVIEFGQEIDKDPAIQEDFQREIIFRGGKIDPKRVAEESMPAALLLA